MLKLIAQANGTRGHEAAWREKRLRLWWRASDGIARQNRRMNSTLENRMLNKEQAAEELAKRVSPETVIRRDEPLAKRTTLRVGGPADIYVEPASEADLAAVLKFCSEQDMKFFVLGRGSNLIVRDGGFRGVVISLAAPFFSRIEIKGERLHCGAGAKLKNVAVEAKRSGVGRSRIHGRHSRARSAAPCA